MSRGERKSKNMTDWSKVKIGARVQVAYSQNDKRDRTFLQYGCSGFKHYIIVYDDDSWNRDVVLPEQVTLISDNTTCEDCKYFQCTHPNKESCRHCELWWGVEPTEEGETPQEEKVWKLP